MIRLDKSLGDELDINKDRWQMSCHDENMTFYLSRALNLLLFYYVNVRGNHTVNWIMNCVNFDDTTLKKSLSQGADASLVLATMSRNMTTVTNRVPLRLHLFNVACANKNQYLPDIRSILCLFSQYNISDTCWSIIISADLRNYVCEILLQPALAHSLRRCWPMRQLKSQK